MIVVCSKKVKNSFKGTFYKIAGCFTKRYVGDQVSAKFNKINFQVRRGSVS